MQTMIKKNNLQDLPIKKHTKNYNNSDYSHITNTLIHKKKNQKQENHFKSSKKT